MAVFTLNLIASNEEQHFDNVLSFIGEDASGYFGLQANHIDFMTVLIFGLARFRCDENQWHYLALPGALASFQANQLTISTRYFLIDTDFNRISDLLEQQALKEQENMRSTRESLQRMELTVFKKIRDLKHDTRWQS
jgi:F-type H+-transporting ATPase subunit epsilon